LIGDKVKLFINSKERQDSEERVSGIGTLLRDSDDDNEEKGKIRFQGIKKKKKFDLKF